MASQVMRGRFSMSASDDEIHEPVRKDEEGLQEIREKPRRHQNEEDEDPVALDALELHRPAVGKKAVEDPSAVKGQNRQKIERHEDEVHP